MNKYPNIDNCQKFSHKKIADLKQAFEKALKNEHISLVITGSFARGEASENSDLDLFVLVRNNMCELCYDEKEQINEIINAHIERSVGDSGLFGAQAIETNENILTNIGGDKDDNAKFTRRMLFLLESQSLYNDVLYRDTKIKLVEKYMHDIQDDRLARFLLNDFIRYYRTITTDFEYKVNEAGKSWGLRNIKLTFSRKILYFAGIMAVAEIWDPSHVKKNEKMIELLEYTPIERIKLLCKDKADTILKKYDYFLGELAKEDVRKELEKVCVKTKNNAGKFRELKDKSKSFSLDLEAALKANYQSDHPIHNALLF